MTTLTDVHRFLAAGLRDDPLLCLAQTVAYLDPFWQGLDDDMYYDDDPLAAALDITRSAFPCIYAQAVNALHHGTEHDDLDRLICAEISVLGIPLDSIEGMGFGIPLPVYGTVLHDPEFYAHHPDIAQVVRMFGIQPEDDYPIDVPDRVCEAAHRLMSSLLEHSDERYQQVGWLMGFVSSTTGNSSVDYSWETLAQFQPLSWEPNDFAFAVEIIREADEIMAAAQSGLELIQANATLRHALQDNIQRLYRSFARQSKSRKEPKNHDHPRLHWPALDSGLTGTTESDT